MAPPRKSLRLARELALDPTLELTKQYRSPHVLRHLCQLADDKFSWGDSGCLRLARICCRIAGYLKTDEARAQSFARLALGLCMKNRLAHAEQAIEIGLRVASGTIRGDLLRRRSIIRYFQHRFEEALRDAEAALKLTDGTQRTVAREVLGIVHYYMGDVRLAIRELARALHETDPDSDPLFSIAIQNYATALAEGTEEEASRALALCRDLRSQLKERHKMQRAKLWWTEGLLYKRFGDLTAAWRAFDIARRSLIALKALPEIGAITADMAQISKQPPAVRHLCSEAADVILAPHPLSEPLRVLEDAGPSSIPHAAGALRHAASKLAYCPQM